MHSDAVNEKRSLNVAVGKFFENERKGIESVADESGDVGSVEKPHDYAVYQGTERVVVAVLDVYEFAERCLADVEREENGACLLDGKVEVGFEEHGERVEREVGSCRSRAARKVQCAAVGLCKRKTRKFPVNGSLRIHAKIFARLSYTV